MSASKRHLLLAEDDPHMRALLGENLRSAGYELTVAEDGQQAKEALEANDFDLLLLDVMMPKRDGFELTSWYRKMNTDTPVIFITARTMVEDVVRGFGVGADDYLCKPFHVEELLCRIEARLSRAEPKEPLPTEFEFGGVTYRANERVLIYESDHWQLSQTENDILQLLASNDGKLVSRKEILMSIWNRHDEYTSKTLDVHLTRIRKTLREIPALELENVHGLGYRLSIRTETAG